MAITLLDALNKPKPLAKQAEEAGMSQTPVTGSVASSLGATPKQAQMAGSAQAKQAEARRQSQQVRRQAQLQAQAPRDVAGSQDSVAQAQNLIDKLANFQSSVDTASQQALQSPVAEGVARGQQDFITEAGDRVLALSDATLRQDAIDALDEVFTGEEGLDQSLTVTLSEIREAQPEIYQYGKNVLGLDENATVEQIKSAVDTEIAEMTEIVDFQRDRLNDPNSTPLERQEARSLMRDYGAAHLIATDKELDDFKKDISSIGIMEFDGQQFTLEDLADNEAVMASLLTAATTLMDDPEASAEDLQLQNYPELFNFVKKHTNPLVSILEQETENLAQVQSTVKSNQDLLSTMTPEVKELMELTPFTADNLLEQNAALKIFSADPSMMVGDIPATEARDLITEWARLKPGSAKALLGSEEMLDKHLGTVKNRMTKYNNIEQMQGTDALVASVVPNFNETSQIARLVKDVEEFGFGYDPEVFKAVRMFDKNKDGVVDDPEQLKVWMKKMVLDGKTLPKLPENTYSATLIDKRLDAKKAAGKPFRQEFLDKAARKNLKKGEFSDAIRTIKTYQKALKESLEDVPKELRGSYTTGGAFLQRKEMLDKALSNVREQQREVSRRERLARQQEEKRIEEERAKQIVRSGSEKGVPSKVGDFIASPLQVAAEQLQRTPGGIRDAGDSASGKLKATRKKIFG